MARSKLLHVLAYAFVAGPMALLWMFLTAGHLGYAHALALFMVASVVIHPLALGYTWRRSVRGAVLAAALGLPLLLYANRVTVVAALSLVILGLARSAVLWPRPFARALVYEVVFLGAGVVSTWFFYDGTAVGIVFSVWSFWLVQAGFVLTPSTLQPTASPATDPFERACAAAQAVLEGRPH